MEGPWLTAKSVQEWLYDCVIFIASLRVSSTDPLPGLNVSANQLHLTSMHLHDADYHWPRFKSSASRTSPAENSRSSHSHLVAQRPFTQRLSANLGHGRRLFPPRPSASAWKSLELWCLFQYMAPPRSVWPGSPGCCCDRCLSTMSFHV